MTDNRTKLVDEPVVDKFGNVEEKPKSHIPD